MLLENLHLLRANGDRLFRAWEKHTTVFEQINTDDAFVWDPEGTEDRLYAPPVAAGDGPDIKVVVLKSVEKRDGLPKVAYSFWQMSGAKMSYPDGGEELIGVRCTGDCADLVASKTCQETDNIGASLLNLAALNLIEISGEKNISKRTEVRMIDTLRLREICEGPEFPIDFSASRVIGPDVGWRDPKEELLDLPIEHCFADIAADYSPVAIKGRDLSGTVSMVGMAEEELLNVWVP